VPCQKLAIGSQKALAGRAKRAVFERVVIASVLELIADAPAYPDPVVGRRGDIPQIKKSVQVSTQEQRRSKASVTITRKLP
jgi:hypothetical protein